jgi:hypothetical protein
MRFCKWVRFFFPLTIILIIAFGFQGKKEEVAPLNIPELLNRVSELSRLPINHPVSFGEKSRDELFDYLNKTLDAELPPDKALAISRSWALLGLIPEGVDLRRLLLSVLLEQAGGYYDPKEGKLFLIKGYDPLIERIIVIHELVHALQDQTISLSMLEERSKRNDDLALSWQSVIEGQATAVMFEFMSGKKITELPDLSQMSEGLLSFQFSGFQAFANAPRYLKLRLVFPYLSGASFIRGYDGKSEGRDWVYLLKNLPQSTEQIIHPGKYQLDPPQEVGMPDIPLQLIYTDTLGELGVYGLLSRFLAEEEANRGSAGWDGGRYFTYQERNNKPFLVTVTLWDSAKEAEEFYNLYGRLVIKRYPEAKRIKDEPYLLFQQGDRFIFVETNGNKVVTISRAKGSDISLVRRRLSSNN